MIEENKGNKIDKGVYYGAVGCDSGLELHLDSTTPEKQRNVLTIAVAGAAITAGHDTQDNV